MDIQFKKQDAKIVRRKFIFLVLLVVSTIFSHYIMKHGIVQNNRRNAVLERELLSERAINRELTAEYNELQGYSTIVTLANEKLGMVIPKNDKNMVQVVHRDMTRNKQLPRLFDFISPSVEAATSSSF